MSGIAADNVNDNLRIGFAIGAGCLVGAQKKEIMMCVCELLLANGHQKQYDFAKHLFEDLDLSINSDLTRRYSTFIGTIINIQSRCAEIFNELIFHFEYYDIDFYGIRRFMKINRKKNGDNKILSLFIAINECLINFENCAQIRGMFSNVCTEHLNQIDVITDENLGILASMLVLFKYGYQYIPYPVRFSYNNTTTELQIEMPSNVAARAISYRALTNFLENIEPYKQQHLKITLINVEFNNAHHDCILQLKNILRHLNIISELYVTFECENDQELSSFPLYAFESSLREDPLICSEILLRHMIVNSDPWLRCRIIADILSITNVKKINFSYASWWRSRFDKDIRAVKLEENALYSRLLPIFDSVTSKRSENSLKLLADQPQEPAVKRLSHNRV